MLSFSHRSRLLPAGALLGVLLVLSACGYRPLYGQYSSGGQSVSAAAALAAIDVKPMRDRTGQLMRTALQRRLNQRGSVEALYDLHVTVTETVVELAVEQNSFATRANLTLTATYQLVRSSDDLLLTNGKQRAVASYNIITSDFATLAAQADARERAIDMLSDDIQSRLGIYFMRSIEPTADSRNP